MIIEIAVALVLGVLFGTFTGLTPGIHVNLVAATLVGLSIENPLFSIVLIIAMAITHTYLDSIPSIFLGAPDPAHALSVLPGHKMLMEGKGIQAVNLTLLGSGMSMLLALLISPLFYYFIQNLYPLVKEYIPYFLILIAATLIIKDNNKTMALLLFLASGVLGYIVFQLPMKNSLFPLLSGLFGVSTLLLSLKNKNHIRTQAKNQEVELKIKPSIIATISGSVTGITPGIGSSSAAALASSLWKKISPENFLILVGGITTTNFFMSILTYFLLGKARNGAIIAVKELAQPSIELVVLIVGVALIAGATSILVARKISDKAADLLLKIPYKKLVLSVVLFILIMTLVLSGWIGLLVLGVATIIGLWAPIYGTARLHAMGCILLPVTIFLLT